MGTFLETAAGLKPTLIHKSVSPQWLVRLKKDDTVFHGTGVEHVASAEHIKTKDFNKLDSVIIDFADHLVGYLSLDVHLRGDPQDAPAKIRFSFGELPFELAEPFESYKGVLSSAWLQEETVFVDVLPATLTLPRRYSFRYLKIELLDSSPSFSVFFDNIICDTVSSADETKIVPFGTKDEKLRHMDYIGIMTLKDCMQNVFEDGPKRDRRLWIGDLRLQALVNYYTFRENDLVKRCLYLFAGLTNENGQIASCIFDVPKPAAGNVYLLDYSLFFLSALYDYYIYTNDTKTVTELWQVALRQLEIAASRLDENNIIRDDKTWWSFIDWHKDLNKQAPTQGVLLYALCRAEMLAKNLNDQKALDLITALFHRALDGAQKLWDGEWFVSGENRQVSWAGQVWMVLGRALDGEQSTNLLKRLIASGTKYTGMATPYMVHHMVEALIQCGLREQALEYLNGYWGHMIENGADRYFELYNPDNMGESPYGDNRINSFCHAWSCTPSYFIRKYEAFFTE